MQKLVYAWHGIPPNVDNGFHYRLFIPNDMNADFIESTIRKISQKSLFLKNIIFKNSKFFDSSKCS